MSQYLQQSHQVPVLDADLYARQGVEPGLKAFEEVVRRYGAGILLPEGQIDRSQLGRIIFHDRDERRWLEALIHPWVEQCFQQGLAQHWEQPIVVLAIPLLFETGYHRSPWVTETWVVYCTPQQQRDRLMDRNGLSSLEAQARIEAQLPVADKCAMADWVLENTGSLRDLYTQIDRALASPSPQQSSL